jgi:hypothetical protein
MGDARKTLQGNALEGSYNESYLALKVVSTSGSISGAIEVVRQAFLAAPQDVLSMLFAPGLHKSLYCTLESEGEEIDIGALRTLVDLGIQLEIGGGNEFHTQPLKTTTRKS